MRIYLALVKEAEQNPSQTLVKTCRAAGTGCSSSLKINPGTALSLAENPSIILTEKVRLER